MNTEPCFFSDQETRVLNDSFSLYDPNGTGRIQNSDLGKVLEHLGQDPLEAVDMLTELGKIVGPRIDHSLSFEEFLQLMKSRSGSIDPFNCGPDPKVIEFINILEEYRCKCEEEGNYLEAARADVQLQTLRKQESRRQSKSLKARQIAERQDVQLAHNIQYSGFNESWDKYMKDYDEMAGMYVQQMMDKHKVHLCKFQKCLHQEIMDRPPKFSKELIEWRKRQQTLARQKLYGEAQKMKLVADEMEEKERLKMNEDYNQIFLRKETKFRAQQQSELQALLKRIDGRRKEHLKQRNIDSKRLLQRNRNVQAVLESKQVVETSKQMHFIKSSLVPKEKIPKLSFNAIPEEARVVKTKKNTKVT